MAAMAATPGPRPPAPRCHHAPPAITAYGVLAQSIAGSGGHAASKPAALVALGGDGAGGGTPGEAIIRNSGNITTDGYSAPTASSLQSIGGGGGARDRPAAC